VALGQLVTAAGLSLPSPSGDAVNAFHATLQSIQSRAGGVLPIPTSTIRVPMFDDGGHGDGAMEPDGVYNHRLKDLTRVEGTYQFHAVATYGEGCRATREAFWSIHVEPGIDPGRSDVTLVGVSNQPDGLHGTLVVTPRGVYGNPLGPGRGDKFTVSPLPGVKIAGQVKDQGDGSYGVSVVWDVSVVPGVLVNQPDRDPVTMTPPAPGRDCSKAAGNLLECLGLPNPDVKNVRVKKVCIEVELKCVKDPDC
jgi:hypothetical protein